MIRFFNQNKNIKNKQIKKNQSHYSEDEDYFNQNLQHYINLQNNNWNADQLDKIYQPDIFEYYTHSKQTR